MNPSAVTVDAATAYPFANVVQMLRGGQHPAVGTRDLLVYLHVPFCSTKCTFCHWVADVPVRDLREADAVRKLYVAAVCDQIRSYGPILSDLGYVPKLIYWGGGTPSRLEPEDFRSIGAALGSSFDTRSVIEHTLESSPETLTRGKLEAMRAVGVDRVSVGIQSFDHGELRVAGRAHTARQAESSYALVREAGFSNVNVDLIAGFPRQTSEGLARSLARCIDLQPDHVTLYVYSADVRTSMGRRVRAAEDPGARAQRRITLYGQGRDALLEAGFLEYMPMYFARDDAHRFRGEQYYFGIEGDSIGFGSGAHSIVARHLLRNHPGELRRFLAAPTGFDVCERFSPEVLADHPMAVGQVLEAGLSLSRQRFLDRFGFDLRDIRDSPWLKDYLRMAERCGSVIVEDDEALQIRWHPERRWIAYD